MSDAGPKSGAQSDNQLLISTKSKPMKAEGSKLDINLIDINDEHFMSSPSSAGSRPYGDA